MSAPAEMCLLVFENVSCFGQENCTQAYFVSPFYCLSLTVVRKRQKKEHDKAWKHEERRSSGDHRRSSGQQAARRGSGGRRRDWNSDESSDGSPPPNLNDGTAYSWFRQLILHLSQLRVCSRSFHQFGLSAAAAAAAVEVPDFDIR